MPLVLSVRRLIDFGFAKVLRTGAKTFTLCGTPQYLAPEIVTSAGHGLSVDCWAFGVLMYEMLHGHTPFDGSSSMSIYQKIMSGKVNYSPAVRPAARELMQKLLIANPTKRPTVQSIKKEPIFRALDFEKLERKEVKPPWKPRLRGPTDLSYIPNARAAEEEEQDDPFSGAPDVSPNGPLKEVGRLDAEFAHL